MVRRAKMFGRKAETSVKTKAKSPRGRKAVIKALNEEDLRLKIEQKAFELFERRGYQHGWHDYDWKMAESLVKLEAAKVRKTRAKSLSPEAVQKKAFEIFAGRGFTHGSDNIDWYLAEEFTKFDQSKK